MIDNEELLNDEGAKNFVELIELLRELQAHPNNAKEDADNKLYLLDKDGNKIIL